MAQTLRSNTPMARPSFSSLFTLVLFLCLPLVVYPYSFSGLQTEYYAADSVEKLGARATFNDILNLLGTPEQAASVNPQIAQQLKSCFNYLVPPLTITDGNMNFSNPIEMVTSTRNVEVANSDDDQIWFGNDAIQELVTLVIDSGGSTDAIKRELNPNSIPVPDVEGSTAARCQLTRTPSCFRFRKEALNQYQTFLFNLIVGRTSNVLLNRFDLFHGHLFVTRDARIGILYHAKEYPAQSAQFPYPLGHCQTGSTVQYVVSQMNVRNILWLAPYITRDKYAPGALLILDARPGGIIYQDIVIDELKVFRTIDEAGFGAIAVDSNYLNTGRTGAPNYQLYVC